ncbi:MAG: hypothetical protein ABI594_01325 [Ginsengibacter sp.]
MKRFTVVCSLILLLFLINQVSAQSTVAAKPRAFVIHLYADNGYKLYVNDSLVSVGPVRSDLAY